MTDDGVITHDEVLRWQPEAIRREWAEAERARELALPPEQRGWYTEAEAEASPGAFVHAINLSEREGRYYRVDLGRP